MTGCSLLTLKCFRTVDKRMIPKNADLAANANRAALARMVVRARAPLHLAAPPPRRGKGTPQKIENAPAGNFLVRNPPKSIEVKYPSQVAVDRKLDRRAAMVAQDGLLPSPGLDQQKMLLPSKRKP